MNKKIECLKRLFELEGSYIEMCEFFIELGLTTEQEVNTKTRIEEKAEFVLTVLSKESKGHGCKFQLVSWEWQMLPIELIKISCVTENEIRYFSHGH